MKTPGQIASQAHEKRLAGAYDGQVSAASGAFWSRKNDVRTEHLCIEHKYTSNQHSLSVKSSWLVKLERDAIKDSRVPVLAFHLAGRDYMILNEDDFAMMYEAWTNAK